jgi:hypothetical protein
MMFPDTSNAQQSAALRQAAERSRSLCNSRNLYEPVKYKPIALRREAFTASSNQTRTGNPSIQEVIQASR